MYFIFVLLLCTLFLTIFLLIFRWVKGKVIEAIVGGIEDEERGFDVMMASISWWVWPNAEARVVSGFSQNQISLGPSMDSK